MRTLDLFLIENSDELPGRILLKIGSPEEVDDCWVWVGPKTRSGYGLARPPRKENTTAHRAIYELLVGRIPEGMDLHHLCENPACVNPRRLRRRSRGWSIGGRRCLRAGILGRTASTATSSRPRTRISGRMVGGCVGSAAPRGYANGGFEGRADQSDRPISLERARAAHTSVRNIILNGARFRRFRKGGLKPDSLSRLITR